MVEFVESKRTGDVWFSPVIFNSDERTSVNAKEVSIAGADADACDPNNFRAQPTISVQTSEGHWHVYWALNKAENPNEVAKLNRRISQVHKDQGCDTAFVNAAKLLRVPGTSNSKHPGALVIVADAEPEKHYTLKALEKKYPVEEVPDALEVIQTEVPEGLEQYIQENRTSLMAGLPNTLELRDLLFKNFEQGSRSEPRFKLLCELYRLGLDDQGVMAVAWGAKTNKYNGEDPRGIAGLWFEAQKAKAFVNEEQEQAEEHQEDGVVVVKPQPPKIRTTFLNDEEIEEVKSTVTFIDEWTAWASTKTDAPLEYHRIAAIMVLSTIYSEYGHVNPTFGVLKLNLWALVLGRSTKDRKTTAQKYAIRMLQRLTDDTHTYILPNDATAGGLNVALLDRADKASIIVRDEAQGFFEEMTSQSYMAGGISYYTTLYDGDSGGRARASGDKKVQQSVPVSFIFYMGGILKDSTEVLTVRNFTQGFLTRFLYVIGERPEGYVSPPTEFLEDDEEDHTDEVFNGLAKQLALNRNYWEMVAGENRVKINLDPLVVKRYQQFEKDVEAAANNTKYAEIIDSTSDRMVKSVLKLSALLAMHERNPRIEMRHMLQAISYAGEWFDNAVTVASMISESDFERDVNKLETYLMSKGGRAMYTTVYRHKDFSGKRPQEFEELVTALEKSGKLERVQVGAKWQLVLLNE